MFFSGSSLFQVGKEAKKEKTIWKAGTQEKIWKARVSRAGASESKYLGWQRNSRDRQIHKKIRTPHCIPPSVQLLFLSS